MAGKCIKCGKTHLPPRPMCDNCLSQEFNWIEVPKEGKLLTYTTIYVAPNRFQDKTPYSVGIIQLGEELNLPGMISDIDKKDLKIGMILEIDFESCENSQSWPKWSRYCFKEKSN
jgi:uncharacterized OB-fold protein